MEKVELDEIEEIYAKFVAEGNLKESKALDIAKKDLAKTLNEEQLELLRRFIVFYECTNAENDYNLIKFVLKNQKK